MAAISTQVWILLLTVIIVVVTIARRSSHLHILYQSIVLQAEPLAPLALADNQLTVDEMTYSVFGQRRNRSAKIHSATYLNYVRSHIAKPSRLRPRVALSSARLAEFGTFVDKKLKGRRNGFFVECGAADGHSYSHTLFLEMERNWTGLLVEANQRYFRKILDLNRQAHVFGGCLSPVRWPRQLRFKAAGDQGGLPILLSSTFRDDIIHQNSYEATYLVQCFPLNDLLAAIGVDHVDYLSLDVQGAEFSILRTIDFRALRIDVIILEVFDRSDKNRAAIVSKIRKLFKETGLYRDGVVYGYDMLFERLDLITE